MKCCCFLKLYRPYFFERAPPFVPFAFHLITLSCATAHPLQHLDLDRPVLDLRLPLVTPADGSNAGYLHAREIRLEGEKVGPLRLRMMGRPVIRDLVVNLPEKNDHTENSWAAAMLEFFRANPHPRPAVLEGLEIRQHNNTLLLHARTAIFDPDREHLELHDCQIRSMAHQDEGSGFRVERCWLLLGGTRAGFVVWPDKSGTTFDGGPLLDLLVDPTHSNR